MATRVRLLGQSAIERDGIVVPFSPERPYQLLAYLACVRQWAERERIALLFWPEHATEAAHRNVRQLIHRARELAGADALEASASKIRWNVATDLAEFDAHLADGDLRAALDLYRGPLLDGLERSAPTTFGEWLLAERAQRARVHRDAAFAALRGETDASSRLELARRLLAIDPLDEDAQAVALETLLALGRRRAAEELMAGYAARLASDLGVEPSARLRGLLPPEVATAGPSERTAADSFVGRRLELRQLLDLLANGPARAVLLHGPGGIGKSRLAQEALIRLRSQFPDGAHWVALEDIADIALVPARIAQAAALEFRDAGDGMTQIGQLISDHRVLLILDNAEHLAGLGELLAALLARCDGLRLLVTSRTRPGSVEVETLSLQGLEAPDDESLDEQAAEAFDAVRLFVQRAAVHDPRFALGPNVTAVVEIARGLQGMPLAIEMAAAWIRLLPAAEIARELKVSFDLLERDATTAAHGRPEHASMQAVIARSWSLLAPAEREAMARAGIFIGGFTRDAAQAVAGMSMPLLASLVDKSLVQADRERGRFEMHPLVSAYARRQLALEPMREAEARTRHRGYFADWLRRTNAAMRTTDARAFKRLLESDFENCRQAWHGAVEARAADHIAAMAGGLSNYLENSGRYAEGEALLSAALAIDERQPDGSHALAQTCRGIATLQYRAGQHQRLEAVARRGIRMARLSRDTPALMACLNLLGLSHWNRDQFREALPYFEAALKQAEQDGDRYGVAVFSSNIGLVTREAGDFELSLRMLLAAQEMHRRDGNVRGLAINLNNVGNHHRLFGDWEQARRCFNEGLALVEQHGLKGLRSSFIVNLALVDLESGALEAASARLQEMLSLKDRGAEPYLVNSAKLGLARLAGLRGDVPAAYRWLANAIQEARALGGVLHSSKALLVLARIQALEGRLATARVVAAGVLDDPRTTATVRVEAQGVLAMLGADTEAVRPLPPEALDSALDEVVRNHAAADLTA